MIKLEDLKKDEIIFYAYKYHWIKKIRIHKEKEAFDYQEINSPTVYYVEARIIAEGDWDNESREQLFKYNEDDLFKTIEEANEYRDNYRNEMIEYLSKDNNLIKNLYEKAKTFLCEADRILYKELINKLQ